MSTLRVNTIENLSNINITNKIIQIVTSNVTAEVTNATDNWVSTGHSAIITPRSSSSYFLVMFEGGFAKQVSAAGGFGYNIYKNGTAVTTSPSDSGDRPYDTYKDETRIFIRQCKSYYAQTGSTSQAEFGVYFKRYSSANGGTIYFNYLSGSNSTLTVMEIL